MQLMVYSISDNCLLACAIWQFLNITCSVKSLIILNLLSYYYLYLYPLSVTLNYPPKSDLLPSTLATPLLYSMKKKYFTHHPI